MLPDSGLPPLVQAVPEGHAAATHFLGKLLPGNAGFEHEHDAAQTDAVVLARLANSGHIRMFGKDRLDQGPQLVGHQQFAHGVLHDDDA